MYEAKYQKFITKSNTRFAEPEEIMAVSKALHDNKAKKCPSGIPLYYDNGELYVDDEDNHSMIIGPTGCKKSRTTVFTTVASIIEGGESAVINDPKGEIFRRTSERAKERGADVFLLNFRDPKNSHYWNPLSQAYSYYKAGLEDEALQSITDFSDSVMSAALETTNDRYWIDTARQFLTSIALILMASVPPEYFNMTNLIPFCYEKNERYLAELLQEMDETSTAAFGLHTVLDLEAERTRSCVYSSMLACLCPFIQNRSLLTLISGNSFDIESLGKKQTFIYIVYPDEKNTLNFLVNMFFTQVYEVLVNLAGRSNNDRLPVRVNFVLDEFTNLTPISNMDNRISEARSKNIRFFIYCQSLAALKHKYKEHAESILSNCNNWLCFSTTEMEWLEKLARISGKDSDFNGVEHDLISPFEMQHLKKEKEQVEVLIIKQGQYPFITQLPDFDYVEMFKNYPVATMPKVRAVSNAKYIGFFQWLQKLGREGFPKPFRKVA